MTATDRPVGEARPAARFRMHWHVVLTHFPISAFLGAFMFMGLHVITGNACYSLAAYVSLVAGAGVMFPTAMTGWFAWRRGYEAFRSPAFLAKIWVAVAMLTLSLALVVYQTAYPFTLLDATHHVAHAIYFSGVTLLMIGALAEGYWGGRLHHR